MPQLIYHLAVFGTFLVAAITLRHARSDSERLVFLGTAIVYGFLLEMAVIVLFGLHSYPAGRFLFYLWAVPVFIPLAWGVIIYASFTTGRHLGLPRSHLPVFAGLFALHIDLAIEVTAVRVPLWTWHLPGVWFGIPIVNFVGWYGVAFLFTGFFLYFGDTIESYVLVGALSLLASTGVLLIVVGVWLEFVSPSFVREVLLFGTIVLLSLMYLSRGRFRPGRHPERFPAETFVSVLVIHLFYLQTSLYYGYYRDVPLLLSVAMLLVGISVHYLHYLPEKTPGVARGRRRMGNR